MPCAFAYNDQSVNEPSCPANSFSLEDVVL